MTVADGSMPLRTEHDIVMSRQKVRALTQQLQFSLVDQTKMVTAASELSRNTVVYGRRGLRLWFEDRGPGIPNLQLALRDGWTSGAGLGVGLSGSRRLVNEFDIRSVVGEGTCVTITRWR